MAKNLVIVESPAKVKTIKKFLGSNYEVEASMGHVRDLPKSRMGIDVENDYEPKYITIRGKGDLLAKLRKAAKNADHIYLATDPDREGEAISWHLGFALNLDDKKVKRVTFNEITKNAVKEALKHPRQIDMSLVDAQQARRILDRMVGYSISPLLWAKVKRGLSAGRVQSVALRMIGDREDEINAFIPAEYWTLDADFSLEGTRKKLTARYAGRLSEDKKETISSKAELDAVKKDLKKAAYAIKEVKKSVRTRKAPLPFTTSTLQQEASKALNFSTSKTMRIAQQLYEGVDIKGSGTVGVITYLRTDSTRISDEADAAARAYIAREYGEKAVAEGASAKKAGRIQDAHEGIRPTDIERTPVRIKDSLTRDQFRLYQLIWKRFTASRMADAVYDTVHVKIGAGDHRFDASGSYLKSAGYMNVYTAASETGDKSSDVLKGLTEETALTFEAFKEEQHFTQPPAHFTEASLVKALEEKGIGRPSTYAPTISTILARRYVTKEQKNLYITELGQVVNNIMKQAFPIIVDEDFTANLETLLDGVAEGSVDWKVVIRNFYPDLETAVKKAESELDKVRIEDEVTDEICENCGRHMVIKYGANGKFLACPGFPDCRTTKPYFEKVGVSCPLCGQDVVLKRTRKGRIYYGCINAECDFMSWAKPAGKACPRCGKYLIIRGKKLVCSDNSCGYSENVKAET